MLKKILYAIIVLVIIIILVIMWKDSSNPIMVEPTPINQSQNDTPANINKDIDNINVDSGIDADLNAIDAELNTL